MYLYEYLRRLQEPVPPWLAEFQTGQAFRNDRFFSSRIVYYPGSGTDGQPVKLFGSTHSAHCFIYVDCGMDQERIEAELENPATRFRGYHSLSRVQIVECDLVPSQWNSIVPRGDAKPEMYQFASAAPFGFLEILERDDCASESHGASRLAILFLGADGIATYDALFCQFGSPAPPYVVVLQDHGFGGNYDRFGRGGLLEQLAERANALPPRLLVAENTKAWKGYEPLAGVEGDCGGMHNTPRFLYQRVESAR